MKKGFGVGSREKKGFGGWVWLGSRENKDMGRLGNSAIHFVTFESKYFLKNQSTWITGQWPT